MARALITGGTGFVGRHLVSFLQAQRHSVSVLSRSSLSSASGAQFYQLDLGDAARVQSLLHEIRPDWIFHLAGISTMDAAAANPALTYEVNVGGARNLFAAAASAVPSAQVLNVSTSQVYAPSRDALTEQSVTEPVGPYATSKAMAEAIAAQYDSVITVRPFNHAGPGQSENFVLSSIAKQFVDIETGRKSPALTLGNVHVRRDFTDVRDVVRAYWLLLSKNVGSGPYNVCSGSATSIAEIIEKFQQITGISVAIESSPARTRSGETEQIKGDPDKIFRATGWRAEIEMETTLHDLLEFWRARSRSHRAENQSCTSLPVN